MLKRFAAWLKSLIIPTKAPLAPKKPQGGGGPGEGDGKP